MKSRQNDMHFCCEQTQSIILHELLHVLGAAHEDSRHDRDQHINVDYSAIAQRHLHFFDM